MIALSVDLGPVHKALKALGTTQIPFASALALTKLAQGVAEAERAQTKETFAHPTPFTQNAFRVTAATKGNPVAWVAAKDIAAQYLAPYVFGGDRSYGNKKAMLVPKQIAVNQYGNLPRGKLKQLQGKPGIFIGPVKTKAGVVINGVWQRPVIGIRADGTRGTKSKTIGGTRLANGKTVGGTVVSDGKLKLLVRFEDTTPTNKHFPFFERARAYATRNAQSEFKVALKQAMASRRR